MIRGSTKEMTPLKRRFNNGLLPGKLMDVVLRSAFFLSAVVQVWGHGDFSGPKCTLHILSALPYPKGTPPHSTSYSDGPDIVPAGYLAVEMINNRSDILKDYYLELLEGHDGCGSTTEPPVEHLLVQNMFYSGKNIVGIAGPRCYMSAAVAGLITAKDRVALVNVHTSSLVDLGNANLYPYSFGATPSIERFVDAYVALIKLNKWRHVGTLFQDDAGAYSVFQSLTSKLSHMNGYEVSFSSVITESYLPLDSLQASSARALLISASTNLARMLMCIAYTKGAVFPQYQWTFLYGVPAEFVDIAFKYGGTAYNCSHADLLQALKNSILINFSYKPNPDDWNKMGISGLTYPQYKQEYARAIERYNNGFYGPPVRIANTTLWGNPFHDAVWILALALNATDSRLKAYNKSLCDFTYGQPSITRMIQEEISRLEFLGVGGRIVYSNFSRFTPGVVQMSQVTSDTYEPLGMFNENDMLQIIRLNNDTFLLLQEQIYVLDSVPSIFFLVLAVIALIIAAVFNVLNIVFRHHESVKASSHRLNHLAYAGVYLLSMSVIMLTVIEGFSLPLSVKTIICNGVPWMCSIGFTAIYATVTVKLFRIYKLLVVAAEKFQKPSESNPMRDSVLLAAIAALIVPDVVICAMWMLMDPIEANSYTLIQNDMSEPIYATYESCFVTSGTRFSFLPWMLSLLIYNGALCCIAAFIAFLTRSISVKNFQTGSILIMSAMQFVLCGIFIPTFGILKIYTTEQAQISLTSYMTICLLLLVYLCLFLLFLPPLYPVLKGAMMRSRQAP